MKLVWNIDKAELELAKAFAKNSEISLLKVLKANSFLFYDLYFRKAIQPVFHEVIFGGDLRCDFAWLNDNSLGPEWVLVEVEAPRMRLFNKNLKPSSELNGSIEQIKSWQRYFSENSSEKSRIFGAVAKFRFVLVAGDKQSWSTEHAMKWRKHESEHSSIEIRTSNVFQRPFQYIKDRPSDFWSFNENPVSLPGSKLKQYWEGYGYMDDMRKFFRN